MGWLSWLRRRRRSATTETASGAEYGAPMGMLGGRLRARGVPYQLPRDVEEMNRLDFQHYILRQTLKGNYAAPIGSPNSLLDVGTGTGRWAREMALLFPQATVVGLDITPPPTDEAAESGAGPELRPDNYAFVAGNVLEGLPFADGTFDFTHQRFLVTAIPHARWPGVVSELLRVTRPGGWIESIEVTKQTHGGKAMDQIMTWVEAVVAYRDVIYGDGAHVGELLSGAGLSNVTTRTVGLPVGDYGGRLGKLLAKDVYSAAQAFRGVAVARELATEEQYDHTVDQMQRDLASPQVHCVLPLYIAYGQRPA